MFLLLHERFHLYTPLLAPWTGRGEKAQTNNKQFDTVLMIRNSSNEFSSDSNLNEVILDDVPNNSAVKTENEIHHHRDPV